MRLSPRRPVAVAAIVLTAILATGMIAGCNTSKQTKFGDKAEDWKKGTPPPGWKGPGGSGGPGGPPPGPPK